MPFVEKNAVIAGRAAQDALGRYGLVDEAGRVRLYMIRGDPRMDWRPAADEAKARLQ